MDILNDLFGRLLKSDTNYTKLWGIFTLLCYKSWGKLGEGGSVMGNKYFWNKFSLYGKVNVSYFYASLSNWKQM